MLLDRAPDSQGNYSCVDTLADFPEIVPNGPENLEYPWQWHRQFA